MNELKRINKMVFKKYHKAKYEQKTEMIKTLRVQLENLKLLLTKMENDI